MQIRRPARTAVRRGAALLLALPLAALGAELPPPAAGAVDFNADIRPLFEGRCTACHGPANAMNGLRLDRKADALAGGHSGPAIIPGNSAESRLIHLVAGYRVKVVMPPTGEPLGRAEIGKLRAWIDQGAPWPDGTDAAAAASSRGES